VFGFFMPIMSFGGFFSINCFNLMTGGIPFIGGDFLTSLFCFFLLLSAIAGVALGVLICLNKFNVKPMFDWIIIGVCVGSMLILMLPPIFSKILEEDGSGTGFGLFLLLLGGIASLGLQIYSKIKNE